MVLKKKKKTSPRKVAKKKAIKKKPVIRKTIKKKTAAKRPAKAAKAKKRVSAAAKEEVLGVVTHYFPKVRAAVIKLKGLLSVGDKIRIKGHTTDFTQVVNSIQIDHVVVNQAKKGAEIGLLVNSRVRQHDDVTKA